jgi:hypothetical protein
MLNVVAWSKVGSLDALVVVLVDVDTRGRLLRDLNLVGHLLDLAFREAFVDVEALEIEVGSEVDSMTEEEASEGVEVLEAIAVDLAAIAVGLAAEEELAIKIAEASRMVPHLLVHRVDLDREVASDPAHPMADTTTEDAMAMVGTDVVEEVEEVAMTPGILVVLVEATETPLEMEEVGMANVIDTPTDLDAMKIMDQESGITRANSMMIRDRSGGIEHHIPIEVCWWVSLFNSSDFCLVPHQG